MSWIGVDLDGTLAHYEGWEGMDVIGLPVQPMLTRVKNWIRQGIEVKIFTARAEDPRAEQYIHEWCERHGLPKLEVTNRKDMAMTELWDDRCVTVLPNKGRGMKATEGGFFVPK